MDSIFSFSPEEAAASARAQAAQGVAAGERALAEFMQMLKDARELVVAIDAQRARIVQLESHVAQLSSQIAALEARPPSPPPAPPPPQIVHWGISQETYDEMAGNFQRVRAELQAMRVAGTGLRSQLAAEREARIAAQNTVEPLRVGPFDAPAYELEVVGRDGANRARRLRLVSIVGDKMGTVIAEGLLPAPATYDLGIIARDANQRLSKIRLTPMKEVT